MRASLTSGVAPGRNAAGERINALRRREGAGPVRYVLTVALAALAYYGAGRIGLELAYLNGAVAALWPPAGLGLAVLFLYGVRIWPAIVIGDLALGDYSTPFGTVLAQTLGNTVALVAAALLLRRLTGGRGGLDRVVDVLALFLCALVAAFVSAAFGPLSLWLGDVIPADELGQVFRTWMLGDACGVLVVAPLILTWATAGLRGIHRRELVEGTVVLIVLVVLAELAPQRDVPYVVFPVLLWAAVRFGPRGAATAVFVVCSITVWNTAQNDGPFLRDSITESLLATQLFIAVSALTSLVLAAATAERTAAGEALGGKRGVTACTCGRAGGAAQSGHARRERRAAEPRVRSGHQGGRRSPRAARSNRHALRRRSHGHGRWRLERGRRADPPSGSTFDLDGDTVVATVLRSGSPQRVDHYRDTSGALAETVQRSGYRAAVAAPVTVGGRLWGALAAGTRSDEPLPEGVEQRLCDFADLVAQALANADAHEQLAASRARIVEAGDAERRRLERNLHDGAQQRLVTVAVHLTLIGISLDKDPLAARTMLAEARDELAKGLAELRELARGIHPALLTDQGLGPALQGLVERAPVPVEITELPEERLAGPVEAAAYYLVAEAITNVAKYAHASHVTVSVRRSSEYATVTVSDDGVGGADAAHGTGLRGLADRIEALQGHLYLDSPPERGTRLRAEIPVP